MAQAQPRPQAGILSFGTTDHDYLELDLRDGVGLEAVVDALGPAGELANIGSGVTVTVGFRPELWQALAPQACPEGVHGFDEPVVGPDGFTMPATQHDIAVWIAGGEQDVVFDAAVSVVDTLEPLATVATETVGWVYRRDRDLTGFVDGTENPSPDEAPEDAIVADGPGAGSSILLLQKWEHDTSWRRLARERQEAAIGRTKADSEELDPKPASSHAARTDQDEIGTILRRNTGYGGATDHGTMFVGFSARQDVLHTMLEHMAGADGGPRDELTRYTRPVSGGYYVVPAHTALVETRGD